MTGTALTTYDERWAQDAQRVAAAEPMTGGTWLSIRGGTLMLGEEALPGNQAALIILDSNAENTFYGTKYNPQDPQPPICYAMGRDGAPMFPDIPNMSKAQDYFIPQHIVQGAILGCEGCPMNEWGSAAEGRGKGCQNRRRLAVIPAGFYTPRRGSRDFDLHLFDKPDDLAGSEVAQLKLPVTSVKNWATYVHQLSATHRRPPHGVVTRLSVVPNQKSQFEVLFEPIELVPDDFADVIFRRRDTQVALPLQGYQPPDPNRAPPPPSRGGFRR